MGRSHSAWPGLQGDKTGTIGVVGGDAGGAMLGGVVGGAVILPGLATVGDAEGAMLGAVVGVAGILPGLATVDV